MAFNKVDVNESKLLHKTNYVSNVPPETAVVQIMIHKPSSTEDGKFDFMAIGTGFFISKYAFIVTAKHVFEASVEEVNGKIKRAMDFANGAGLVALVIVNGVAFPCPIHHIALHPTADIALGVVATPKPPTNFAISLCGILLREGNPGEKLIAYGFQRTKLTLKDDDTVEIDLKPQYYDGVITEYHHNGFLLSKWPVYEHTVPMASGISGGPIFLAETKTVLAISCSGWSTSEEDIPFGSATDIRLVLSLPVPKGLSDNDGIVTLEEFLRKEGEL